MITKNGKAIMKCNGVGYKTITLKDTTGSANSPLYGNSSGQINFFNSLKIAFGAGTTEPTVDDYALESQINSLTILSTTNTSSESISYEQDYMAVVTAVVKNNTSESITINEIAIMATGTPVGGSEKNYLITHDIISPVTIEPNKTYNFSVVIS